MIAVYAPIGLCVLGLLMAIPWPSKNPAYVREAPKLRRIGFYVALVGFGVYTLDHMRWNSPVEWIFDIILLSSLAFLALQMLRIVHNTKY